MSKIMPSVAVITRTKDRPLLLERAIKSVMAQSYKDLGMIIVNDGGAVAPINQILKKHKDLIAGRAKLFNNKKSVGMQNAANIGIENSDSIYIALLDDDDSWHQDFLKTTVTFLEDNNCEGVATGSTIVSESIQGEVLKKLGENQFAPFIKSVNYLSMLGINQFPNNAFVYSRQALKKVGLYDQKAGPLGDWEFNKRFMKLYDIPFINEPLAYYHHRYGAKGADTNTISTNQHALLTDQTLNKMFREYLFKYDLTDGLAANMSNEVHRLRIDLSNEIHSLKNTIEGENSLYNKLSQIENRLDGIELMVSSLEARAKTYLKNFPRRLVKKAITPVLRRK